ncbi:hypothetical protein CVIRNUC_002282 [Coccomyxa viridis]|uniref:shikimate dehydrogenase (NADP(+)) n=1 Tax=Coccomyxa viridis TaxID=1274662 RepID=A0AAV1HY09_9CHLO|nr:hypothetical protein CVIRNUC_002282 [Coccomyxa viridis]
MLSGAGSTQIDLASARNVPGCFSGRTQPNHIPSQTTCRHCARSGAQHRTWHPSISVVRDTGHLAVMAAADISSLTSPPQPSSSAPATLICTSITATSVETALREIQEVYELGADAIELRLDFLEDLALKDPGPPLKALLGKCKELDRPAIVTLRPEWEGGQYRGSDVVRLAILKYAAVLGAAYVDVEYLAAEFFFASKGQLPLSTRVILSHHDYKGTPDSSTLEKLMEDMFASGADVAKIATTAEHIQDAARVLALPRKASRPVIALAMGERGVASRILAPKFGSHLTFGALSSEKASAPGQPLLSELKHLYGLPQQSAATKVFGVIGNPVSHSRSPALHNAAMRAAGMDAVYLPLLVDDLQPFLHAFPDFSGFSVTIPHKVAALEAAQEVDAVAARIGAANTLVRQQDGSLKAYNTDWSAAIEAVEEGVGDAAAGAASPLAGMQVVVLGAGGAGRALAFGALQRGAHITIANRTAEKAEELAAALGSGARATTLEAVSSGEVTGDILMNSTSIGMHAMEGQSPVERKALQGYRLVFDAIYTPLRTRLIQDAEAEGCKTVSGLEMFVGQAAQQFELFTGQQAPKDLMRKATLDSMSAH